jgi:hypothetical protein
MEGCTPTNQHEHKVTHVLTHVRERTVEDWSNASRVFNMYLTK